MSKFQLLVPLKPAPRLKLNLFYAFWALLGLATANGLYFFANKISPLIPLLHALPHGLNIVLFSSIFISLGLLYVYVPLQIEISQFSRRNIIANEDGLGIPPKLMGLVCCPWLPWSNITFADLSAKSGRPTKLLLKDKQGKKFSLSLKGVEDKDAEQILLALEAWATSAIWSQALTNYRDRLQNQIRGIDGVTSTQIFEDELARRFSPTTFVPLAPGTNLRSGTLKITRQIAFGGFSAIYTADDTAGETVVVKELVVSKYENDEAKEKILELFRREATLLSALDHPRIVKLKDHFVENGRTYMVLEHVPGRTLSELIRAENSLKEERVIQLGLQMIDILAYLHGREPAVLHRDFTPGNLVLRNDGTLVLIDFGAANEFVFKATGTLIGKQGYMAPEQLRGKAEPASDLYAFGGTLYFLLTGQDPTALTSSNPAREHNVSPELSSIVQRLTALQSGDRFPNAQAAGTELLKIASRSKISSIHSISEGTLQSRPL